MMVITGFYEFSTKKHSVLRIFSKWLRILHTVIKNILKFNCVSDHNNNEQYANYYNKCPQHWYGLMFILIYESKTGIYNTTTIYSEIRKQKTIQKNG